MKDAIYNYLLGIDMPNSRTERNNLNYCTLCEKVYETYWGFHYGSVEKKHHDMPTYGLDRKTCTSCKKEDDVHEKQKI